MKQILHNAGKEETVVFNFSRTHSAATPAAAGSIGRCRLRRPGVAGESSLFRGFAADAGPQARRSQGPVSYLSLGITMATGAALLWYYNSLMTQKLHKAEVQQQSVGKTMVGGPFSLIDHHGKPFTDRDLAGNWSMLYFGFTFCPDICPDELEKLTEAVDSIEKSIGVAVRPVFITLDPDRDTVPQVAEYIKEFHPRLIGLTGSTEQVNAAAKAYRVYHTKTDETEDYLVDHSIIMYLLDPTGQFVQFFGKNFDAAALSKAVQSQISEWKPPEQSKEQQRQ